jgi:hypothetical protein
MKVIPDFLNEIQALDPRFTIVENPHRKGLSNIFFEGVNYDLPVLPSEEINDHPDVKYFYTFPNGMSARFWSRSDVLPRLKSFLDNLEAIKKAHADTE